MNITRRAETIRPHSHGQYHTTWYQLITGAQMRAARALVRWSAEDLARAASVGVMTVRRAEAVDGPTTMLVNNMQAIKRALEAAGVEFTNSDAPGVRFRPAAPQGGITVDKLNAENDG